MEKNTAESVDELNKKSMNQMAGADMKHQTNKGSEIEENDYDAQGALKEVLPNEEQNFDKEEGIEEASLIIAVDVDSKNISESDTVSGEQRHVEMANSIEESASLQGSSITADGMSSTSDVDSKSTSGDVGIINAQHSSEETVSDVASSITAVHETSNNLDATSCASIDVQIMKGENMGEKTATQQLSSHLSDVKFIYTDDDDIIDLEEFGFYDMKHCIEGKNSEQASSLDAHGESCSEDGKTKRLIGDFEDVVHERFGVVELPVSRHGKGGFETRGVRTVLVECWIEDKVPAKASSINGDVGSSKNDGDTKAVSKKVVFCARDVFHDDWWFLKSRNRCIGWGLVFLFSAFFLTPTAESVDELNKKSMNQMACADMKHETNKGSEIEENDYDAQGALKEVLPNEEQNFDKEEGIEEASLIIAVDVDSKNINESDTVSGEQRHVEMANSIEESASLQGSSITADGMSSTSDVDSKSTSGDVGIINAQHSSEETVSDVASSITAVHETSNNLDATSCTSIDVQIMKGENMGEKTATQQLSSHLSDVKFIYTDDDDIIDLEEFGFYDMKHCIEGKNSEQASSLDAHGESCSEDGKTKRLIGDFEDVVHERFGVVELPVSRHGKGGFETRGVRTVLVECWIEDKVPAKASSINGDVGSSKNDGDTKAVSKKVVFCARDVFHDDWWFLKSRNRCIGWGLVFLFSAFFLTPVEVVALFIALYFMHAMSLHDREMHSQK
ncbi:hypothetical protein T01_84 [Trichinella spiralis]|uniref:Uncharacterized protein n=1 Tax=Trichinella spiralis TaxID=6334 RepID=A0A0V1B621_TRISP|nr:hypothetical protein T01_84 [Trichinella spiralis]